MQYKEVYFEQESEALKFVDDYWDRIVEMVVSTGKTNDCRYCVLYAKEAVAPNVANVSNASGTAKTSLTKMKSKGV